MRKSYLVDGAKLRCVCGSKTGCLRVSAGCNNYAENGKQKASSADCKPEDNIPVPVGALCRSAHRIKADHVMEIVAKSMNKKQEQQILDYYSTTDKYIRSKTQSNVRAVGS